jgi:hypothetical protein
MADLSRLDIRRSLAISVCRVRAMVAETKRPSEAT